MTLEDLIALEATKHIKRWEQYAQRLHDEMDRRERRSGSRPVKVLKRPSYWEAAPGFNPYKVRSRTVQIAHTVNTALKDGTYEPFNALTYRVPKSDGSDRPTSVFQLADSAISSATFRTLLKKNSARFSNRSFAYRHDLTVHDAVQYIAGEMISSRRIFIAEFDFQKFFDWISHDHIRRTLSDQRFLVSTKELGIIEAFLRTPTVDISDYQSRNLRSREVGIPQGTSISLFLANVAAHPIDRALEKIGVGHARFADDTLVWSTDYTQVCHAADVFYESLESLGVKVNHEKSGGISLFVEGGSKAEIKAKDSVEFVGYRFTARSTKGTVGETSIRASSVKKIKNKISEIVYHNLLENPLRGVVIPKRIEPQIDRDYVTMLWQIRRFLYGDLSELQISRFLTGSVPMVHFKGIMSFYPLVDDVQQLKELDGWLLDTIFLAERKRERLLKAQGFTSLPSPLGATKQDLVELRGYTRAGVPLDLRMPSFRRIGELMRVASRIHGPNAVANRRTVSYYPD